MELLLSRGICAGDLGGMKNGKCETTNTTNKPNGATCRKNKECKSGMCAGNLGGMKNGKCKTLDAIDKFLSRLPPLLGPFKPFLECKVKPVLLNFKAPVVSSRPSGT